MSTPICPRCGDPLRCACGIAHHDASVGAAAAPAQFEREWIRPYIAPHEPPQGDEPPTVNTATVSWVVTHLVRESGPPPGGDAFGQPVVMSRSGSHRAQRPTKQRRPLRVTAALATLIGSAAIAGTYAFARSQDTEATAQAPASRLDVLDAEDGPSTPPEVSRSPGPPTSSPVRTSPTAGKGPARTPSSAAPSAPATGTATGADAAPAAGPRPGTPNTLPPSPPLPTPPSEQPTLRRHDTGPQVVELQRRLAQLGLWSLPQRGRYDQHLDDAVRRFQAKYGVRGDSPGVYGPASRRRLESLTS